MDCFNSFHFRFYFGVRTMTDSLSPVQMVNHLVTFGAEVTFSKEGRKVAVRISCSNPEDVRIINMTLCKVDEALTRLGFDISEMKSDRLRRELDAYPNQRTDI